MTGNINTHRGFTLVEILVATAVASIVIVVATTLLLIFFRGQKESRNMLTMQAESRSVLSSMSERVKEGTLDYDFYTGDPFEQPEFLALRTRKGVQQVFWFRTEEGITNLFLCRVETIEESCDPNTADEWSQMNGDHIHFVVGKFYIYPARSPYETDPDGNSTPDLVPTITVTMQLSVDYATTKTALIQTVFTPRYYVR
ncbi:MAG: prepilin-type N-terminal cleavage/methylation domain-containing protein [Candidatus Kerfeldbacteria bacterium]|nr:prepilin-type N-terminal cleavage/methylation domain-containing protein [Candidatus Kerfeldbacteria bacterium]